MKALRKAFVAYLVAATSGLRRRAVGRPAVKVAAAMLCEFKVRHSRHGPVRSAAAAGIWCLQWRSCPVTRDAMYGNARRPLKHPLVLKVSETWSTAHRVYCEEV